MREIKYEYLDHTADVQLHAWGDSLEEAFEHIIQCMFNYMTDLDKVDIDDAATLNIKASGHDLESLLFNFMDEALFLSSTEYVIIKMAKIEQFDIVNYVIEAKG